MSPESLQVEGDLALGLRLHIFVGREVRDRAIVLLDDLNVLWPMRWIPIPEDMQKTHLPLHDRNHLRNVL